MHMMSPKGKKIRSPELISVPSGKKLSKFSICRKSLFSSFQSVEGRSEFPVFLKALEEVLSFLFISER